MTPIFRKYRTEPVLKVKTANSKDLLDFCVSGEFSIFDDYGQMVFDKISSNRKWRIKLESYEPAHFVYSVLIDIKNNPKDAENVIQKLNRNGYDAKIEVLGGDFLFQDEIVTKNTQYRIQVGEFNSIEDAKRYRWNCANGWPAEIVREKIREPRGVLELFDAEYTKTAKVKNCIHLIPSHPETETTLYHVITGRDFPRQHCTKRVCRWPMTFRIGNQGMDAIGEIPLERYLKGVLAVEMGPSAPLEALKCQAVVSRGLALTGLGLCHPDEFFDVCSENHCQNFGGVLNSHPRTDRAVEETCGEVLFHNDEMCNTPYTALCGGHTENGDGLLVRPYASYIKAIYDGPNEDIGRRKKLDREDHVSTWILSKPNAYCNTNGQLDFSDFEHHKSTFRWEISYPRKELEDIIRKKTGEDIGTLFDIVPLKRGNSGRLKKIEILGSRKNIKIQSDLHIRQTLSEDILNSSCFIIETELGKDGIPVRFSFIGAGLGHGVGMCQMGAVVLAAEGKTYPAILNHYFKNVELKKIY